jgi:hypothetical protein
MTPREFLDQIVRPNLSEFEAGRLNLRQAFNALASVDALAAHIFVSLEHRRAPAVSGVKDDSDYREKLAERSPDFGIVRDTAKAQKHVKLTRGTPKISSASQIKLQTGGWGQSWGDNWGGGPVVAVELDDASLAFVEPTLKRAISFLEQEMSALCL